MTYLLDTNVVIAILRNKPAGVRKRLRAALARNAELTLSSIALYELWYGVARSDRAEENADRLNIFLSGKIRILGFTHEDARVAGALRATLASRGEMIGAYDVLMAAQALREGATLVTANSSEFDRVPKLKVQDWS